MKSFTGFRLAAVQLHVTKLKAENLARAQRLVKEAAGQGAKVVVLPVSIKRVRAGERFLCEQTFSSNVALTCAPEHLMCHKGHKGHTATNTNDIYPCREHGI